MGRPRSIAEARRDLPGLVREAESGQPVQLTRHGEPVAVLVGRREYARLTGDVPSLADALDAFRREVDLEDLAIDPDEVFGPARDETRGREVDL